MFLSKIISPTIDAPPPIKVSTVGIVGADISLLDEIRAVSTANLLLLQMMGRIY
jgi:hypothetical protein